MQAAVDEISGLSVTSSGKFVWMTGDSPSDACVIVGLEAQGVDAAGELVVRCVILETVSDAKHWQHECPVTREVSVYIGPADAVARLIADGTSAQSPAVDE